MPRIVKRLPRILPGNFDELVRQHPPRPIHDEVSYENSQEIIDSLTSLPKLTRGQREYLETMTILFSAYESQRHAIDTSDLLAVDVLKSLMDEHGMSASDLGRLLGERSLGVKILNGDRELSKTHLRKLAEHFGVRADLFL